MALTAQFYAGDTDKLWVTANGGGMGTHTGTPSNGSLVGVWQDEATPATRNVVLAKGNDSYRPTYATPGAMRLPSLAFDNSTGMYLSSTQNNAMTPVAASSLIGTSGKTIIGAFRMTAAATNNASIWQNSALVCEEGAYFGLHLKSSGGTHSLIAFNWDSGADETTAITITLDTDYVFQLRHNGTTLALSLLSGTGGATRVDQSVASGATNSLTSPVRIGRSYQTHVFAGHIGELYFDDSDLGATNSPLSDIVGRWLPAAAGNTSSMLLVI